jgi:serine/threonine protein kinase
MTEPAVSNLSADPRFADLIEELTEKLQSGQPVDFEACLREHPEYADQIRQLLPALRMLADVSRSGGPTGILTNADDPTSGVLGDFRLIREVGRGGMGVVYEAEQISLKRRVALKVLPFAATMDPRQLVRFQNEARAAASLEHPHIVPVYAVGCERGVHNYAMKFIEGQTVAALIAQQRTDTKPAPATPPADTTPRAQDTTAPMPRDAAYFRRAAEWGIQAAEALEHAHSLGIVHRDIKPANLMIDGQGKLWVTDFGLARTATDAGLTMTGDVLGTLRYMSPEQAQASHGLVDHRTDVYSLGVTLYELLTLQSAVEGDDRARLLQKICLEEPVALRRIDKAIPAELETIVLKAIEKNTKDRYATAQELAKDLRCFVEDRPIEARRPTLRQRVRKWARRHRAFVWMGSVAAIIMMVVVASSSTVGYLLIWQEKKQTQQALDRAEAKTRLARRAVDEMYSGVAEQWLADAPNMTDVQRQFLLKALQFYEELSKEQSTDPGVRLQTAIAYRRMGEIRLSFGSTESSAEEYYRQGLSIATGLVNEFPGEADYRREQFRASLNLGGLFWAHGRWEDAEEPLRRACAISAALVADFPKDAAFQEDRARSLLDLAKCLWRSRPEEAEKVNQEATLIQGQLADAFPGVVNYRYDLAATTIDRVDNQMVSGRLETQDACRHALLELQFVFARCPNSNNRRANMASSNRMQAILLLDLGRLEEAEKLLDLALEIQEDQYKNHLQDRGACTGLAFTYFTRGRFLALANRPEESEEAFLRAQEYLALVLDDLPTSTYRQYEMAIILGHLGWHYLSLPADVERARNALRLIQQAQLLAPDTGSFLATLEGLAYFRLGQWDQAIDVLEKGRNKNAESSESRLGWRKADCTAMVLAATRQEKTAEGLVLLLLAISYQKQGNKTIANDNYKTAQQWQTDHPIDPLKAIELNAIQKEAATIFAGSSPPKEGGQELPSDRK